ncbi:hypothetical protein M422DRAFT_261599, partial [Sphaerobolus stellatus SS14]
MLSSYISNSFDNIHNVAANQTAENILPFALPFTIPSLLLTLFLKNQDFLKLMFIGGILETCRRYSTRLWEWIVSRFRIAIYFESKDETYEWMMVWLAHQDIWKTSRKMYISSESWGKDQKGVELPGMNDNSEDNDVLKKRKLTYLPVYKAEYWFRHRGVWISVIREKEENDHRYEVKEQLTLKIFTTNPGFVRILLQDAKRVYGPDDDDMVYICCPNSYNEYWRVSSSRRKRPLESIILEPEIKDMVLDDAKDFLENEKWYLDRGIPYRRGYLLYGVPGSGKTSLIHSLAGELNLHVYVISLAKKGLDDSSLSNLMAELPKRCIALMEDIDAAFKGSGKRLGIAGSEEPEDDENDKNKEKEKADAEPSSGVTLSGLLNALDGIAAQEGRILFATTNRLAALDDALCRPGRMDVHVEFQNASKWQAKKLFGCFFPPTSKFLGDEDDKVAGAVPKHWQPKATSRFATVPLTDEEAEQYAEQFSEIIPERMFSVATLQGLLLRHKNKPRDAIEASKVWVKQQLEK